MASPIDLTGLADLKAWLGIASTGDDALLSALITETSMAILADLGRGPIQPTVVTDVCDGNGETSIVLRHWPVAQVLAVTVDGMPIAIGAPPSPAAARSLTVILDGADGIPPGGLQRLSLCFGCFPKGFQNIAITYRAGYEIAGEIATIPASAPFTLAATAPYGAWCSTGAVAYANGTPLVPGATPSPGVYTVANGLYGFSVADAGTTVSLRYGYMPADLARGCREWAAERYAYRARIGQSSKTLGGQETVAFIVKAMPDYVARILQPYRRVVAP